MAFWLTAKVYEPRPQFFLSARTRKSRATGVAALALDSAVHDLPGSGVGGLNVGAAGSDPVPLACHCPGRVGAFDPVRRVCVRAKARSQRTERGVARVARSCGRSSVGRAT